MRVDDVQEMARRVQAESAALSALLDDPTEENRRAAVAALDANLSREAQDIALCRRRHLEVINYELRRQIRQELAA